MQFIKDQTSTHKQQKWKNKRQYCSECFQARVDVNVQGIRNEPNQRYNDESTTIIISQKNMTNTQTKTCEKRCSEINVNMLQH